MKGRSGEEVRKEGGVNRGKEERGREGRERPS